MNVPLTFVNNLSSGVSLAFGINGSSTVANIAGNGVTTVSPSVLLAGLTVPVTIESASGLTSAFIFTIPSSGTTYTLGMGGCPNGVQNILTDSASSNYCLYATSNSKAVNLNDILGSVNPNSAANASSSTNAFWGAIILIIIAIILAIIFQATTGRRMAML